ncbi:MAG: hypothetical protein WBY44_16170 [Bryobacteraceae bacterium]
MDETDASPAQDPRLRSHHLHFEWSYKRLEEGTYRLPLGDAAERRREITVQELGALLSGIDLDQAARRKRYQRPQL